MRGLDRGLPGARERKWLKVQGRQRSFPSHRFNRHAREGRGRQATVLSLLVSSPSEHARAIAHRPRTSSQHSPRFVQVDSTRKSRGAGVCSRLQEGRGSVAGDCCLKPGPLHGARLTARDQ